MDNLPQNSKKTCAEDEGFRIPQEKINYEECSSNARDINLNGIEARVDKIHVEGLARTKDDIVKDCIRELFKAAYFQDVLLEAHRARMKLDELGCFKNIGVFIDVSKGPGSSENGLEITFNVKEHQRVVGGVSTQVGNNEGSLLVGLRTPNIFGRGERVQLEYTHGSKGTNTFNLAFVKPFTGRRRPIFSANLFHSYTEFPASGYKESGPGILLDLGFYSFNRTRHNIQWEGVVRDIEVLSRSASFASLEQSGATLKSSLRHIVSLDFRDEVIFPTCGALIKFITEGAGFGGNIGFFKNELLIQQNFSFFDDCVFQCSFSTGAVLGISNDLKITVSDKFFLGGPLSLRGFQMRGVGPHEDGDATGAKAFWSAAAHIFAPLPFRPGKGGFGELFRTHFFVNCGNVSDISKDIINNFRTAVGLGLALRLGNMARVEVNYCFPLQFEKGDVTQPGVQFGIGVHFL